MNCARMRQTKSRDTSRDAASVSADVTSVVIESMTLRFTLCIERVCIEHPLCVLVGQCAPGCERPCVLRIVYSVLKASCGSH